jgi:hypothetical protein
VGRADSHVEAFIPVRVQRLLHNAGCVSLLSVDSDYGERVGKSEDISFGESIGSNDCSDVTTVLRK